MLKRRRKLSKDLQIRKKITTFANVNENGSAHRDSDTRVRQIFLWRAVSLRRFATQCVTINNSYLWQLN